MPLGHLARLATFRRSRNVANLARPLSPYRLDEVQNVFVRGVSFRFSQAFFIQNIMVEPLLSGIVLGFIPVTIAGLFVTAYLQYRRGDQLTF